MKNYIAFLVVMLAASACKSVKKVQIVNAAISKKDTAQTIVIKETERVDSTAIVRDIMGKVIKKKIDFTTFNAKLKIDYEGQETNQKVTGYLSIKKDSTIYATMSVPIIGVVAKVLVTKDSVFVINPLKKNNPIPLYQLLARIYPNTF